MLYLQVHHSADETDSLPLTYEPDLIADYWSRRPVSVITRITQLMGKRCSRSVSGTRMPHRVTARAQPPVLLAPASGVAWHSGQLRRVRLSARCRTAQKDRPSQALKAGAHQCPCPLWFCMHIPSHAGIAGGFLGRLAFDAMRGQLKETEVARAVELRDIMTSLGPAYIKLGQVR